MSFENFYRAAKQRLASEFPSTKVLSDTIEFDRVLSPHRLKLPKQIAERVQAGISAHYQLVNKASVQNLLVQDQPWLKTIPTNPNAVLMSYDFHTTENGEAFLVEVNTNASSYLVSRLMYEAHGLSAQWQGQDAQSALVDSFKKEAGTAKSFAIVDDQVQEQKMYFEFLMYQDLFTANGWRAEIQEASELVWQDRRLQSTAGTCFDFVYNRVTDFYLEDPRHQALRSAYESGSVVFSPHPWAYLLLADKERLTEISQPGWLENQGLDSSAVEALRQILIPTYEKEKLGTSEEIWERRKSLFFKPRRSHGAKSVYRGSSVSRKVFERLMSDDIVIQEFVPAQSWPTSESDQYLENWKFDLRFFVYRDQIQLAVARTYQGQVTNFSSQYGGLTAVEFV